MIYIRFSKPKNGKKQFRVVTDAKMPINRTEILKTSETLSSKQKCFKNILSDIVNNYGGTNEVYIKDETVTKPEVFSFTMDSLRKKAGVKRIYTTSVSAICNPSGIEAKIK